MNLPPKLYSLSRADDAVAKPLQASIGDTLFFVCQHCASGMPPSRRRCPEIPPMHQADAALA
jgi:hypothetical protein